MPTRQRPIAVVVTAASLGLGVLAGCAADQAGPELASGGTGLGLFFDQNPDDGVKLAYGAPNSDAVWLMLTCRPRSGQVEIYQSQGASRGGPMRLASGLRASTLPGRAEREDGPGEVVIRASAKSTEPAFEAFRETGHLEVSGARYRYAIRATPAEREGIGQFFMACGTA